jgi:hypothetical protein
VAKKRTLTSISGLFRAELQADNGRKWKETGQAHKRAGSHNVRCKRCKSVLTVKKGRQINAFQRCRSCNSILRVPVSGFPNSNLPTVTCPECSIPNAVKLIQNWQCMECKTIFFDDDKFHIKESLDNGLGLKTTGAIH